MATDLNMLVVKTRRKMSILLRVRGRALLQPFVKQKKTRDIITLGPDHFKCVRFGQALNKCTTKLWRSVFVYSRSRVTCIQKKYSWSRKTDDRQFHVDVFTNKRSSLSVRLSSANDKKIVFKCLDLYNYC